MKKANGQLKRQLNKEMEHIQFTSQSEVLHRVNPVTWKQKLHRIWNKEITIPLIPVSTVFVLLFVAFSIGEFKPDQKNGHSGVLIQIANNYYWKEDFERMISQNEN